MLEDLAKAKQRERARRWAEANPEKCREASRRHAKANPEKRRESGRKHYARHRDERIAASRARREANPDYGRQWDEANPDKRNARARRHYHRHREACLVRAKDWRTSNKEQVRALDHVRRARELQAEGHFTSDDIDRITKLQKGKCAYCRIGLSGKYHVDHIVALKNGGSNRRSNLQILCQPCNQSKSAKDPIVFAQSRGMLL